MAMAQECVLFSSLRRGINAWPVLKLCFSSTMSLLGKCKLSCPVLSVVKLITDFVPLFSKLHSTFSVASSACWTNTICHVSEGRQSESARAPGAMSR